MFRAAAWPCRSATTQCSTRIRVAGVRIGPARDVAGREDAGRAGLEVLVHGDAAVDRQPRPFGQRDRRPHADAEHEKVGCRACVPSLERDHASLDAGDGLRPGGTSTPCASCSWRMKRPTSGPITRSSGWLSGATTWTASPRARSEAATSRPMKLAPTTTTASRRRPAATIARLSANVRR